MGAGGFSPSTPLPWTMPSTEAPIALVARGAGPIGREVCTRLAERGYDVALTFDQDDEGAQRSARAVEDAGRQALVLGGRVGDPMVGRQLVRRAHRQLGTPTVLVVGPRRAPIAETPRPDRAPDDAFLDVDMATVEPVLQADLKGPMALVQAAAERIRQLEAPAGRVVLVAPDAALRSGPAGAPARAAAAGLVSLASSAAQALAPSLQVNAVLLGLVWPGSDETEDGEGAAGISLDELDAAAAPDEDRWVAPGEVADAIVHLVEAPASVTGQVLRVDRGLDDATLARLPFQQGDDETEPDLPGIEQRVEPPDPEDRIDLD